MLFYCFSIVCQAVRGHELTKFPKLLSGHQVLVSQSLKSNAQHLDTSEPEYNVTHLIKASFSQSSICLVRVVSMRRANLVTGFR
jgi:hypothetical protein